MSTICYIGLLFKINKLRTELFIKVSIKIAGCQSTPLMSNKEVIPLKVQPPSVVAPNQKCVNNCAFCVSKMHCDTHKNQMDDNLPFFDLYMRDYLVVIDADCMDKSEKLDEDYKYLILQPDCKLYSQWDDKSSLIF